MMGLLLLAPELDHTHANNKNTALKSKPKMRHSTAVSLLAQLPARTVIIRRKQQVAKPNMNLNLVDRMLRRLTFNRRRERGSDENRRKANIEMTSIQNGKYNLLSPLNKHTPLLVFFFFFLH